jgi:hypothetical protein
MTSPLDEHGHSVGRPEPRRSVQRRTVLRGAMAGSATLAGLVLTPHSASARTGNGVDNSENLEVRSRAERRAIHDAGGDSTGMPIVLGAMIGVRGRNLPARSIVVLKWDDRLYRVASSVRLSSGGKAIVNEKISYAVDNRTHRATMTLVLPRELQAGRDYELTAGALEAVQFPHDLLPDPVSLTISVRQPGGANHVEARLSGDAAQEGQPWGVVLGAVWQRSGWDDVYGALHPSLVTLRAVGPGAVPAGSSLHIILDPQVFTRISVHQALDSGGHEVRGLSRGVHVVGRPSMTWATRKAVLPGDRIDIGLDITARRMTGALPTLEPPLIYFVGPEGRRAPQRRTGLESLTREDSIYSPATLRQFGG